MVIKFERNDVTKMDVDCIVNAANNTLLGGGGVDGQIHRAAGPELLKECMTLGGCETGKAKITKGYKLKAKYIIHTVGPIYQDGKHNEEKLLTNCYYNSLLLAKENNIKTIAFPLISAGIFGYPKKEAIKVAIKAIKKFGEDNKDYDIEVTLVFFGKTTTNLANELFGDIKSYIDDNYAAEKNLHFGNESRGIFRNSFTGSIIRGRNEVECIKNIHEQKLFGKKEVKKENLAQLIDNLDLSFADALLKLIDEKNLKDVDVYINANMDRKLFSKIRNGSHPKKSTAIALCISLKLSLDETNNLIKKAGYALTDSEKFDVIIKYFIENKNYDINEINAALFSYDQQQLGL